MSLSRIDALLLAQEGLVCASRADIERMQLKKLNALLARERERGGFYRGLPDHLDSLSELVSLPFTTDEDLAHKAPVLLLCSQAEIQRVLSDATSGTTGAATRVFYTEADCEHTIELFMAGLGELIFPGSARNAVINQGELKPRRYIVEENKNQIINMYIRGNTFADIAERTLCSEGGIKDALKRWGLHIPKIIKVSKDRENIIEDNKDLVVKMYRNGKTCREIAEEIGCSGGGIKNALRRWGKINFRENITENNKERIIELYRQGKTLQQIADETGCSKAAAGSALKRWGVHVPQKYIVEDNKDLIIELRRQGKTLLEIAEIVGSKENSICSALKRWGV